MGHYGTGRLVIDHARERLPDQAQKCPCVGQRDRSVSRRADPLRKGMAGQTRELARLVSEETVHKRTPAAVRVDRIPANRPGAKRATFLDDHDALSQKVVEHSKSMRRKQRRHPARAATDNQEMIFLYY